MKDPRLRWHIYPTATALREAAAARLETRATQALEARGDFHIVISGGSTPRGLYAAAARLNTRWTRWHVYFADERCLPVGHTDRNDSMVRHVWLEHVAIPERQIHAIPAELGPEVAAADYGRVLEPVGAFDLVLLGLGDDGHTASLFPGHDPGAGFTAPDALPVRQAPKPPPERVSLSARRLVNTRATDVLVSGAGKQWAVRQLAAGADLPLRAVIPDSGLDILLDDAAAAAEPPSG